MKKVLTGSALMLGFLAFGFATPAQANFSHFSKAQVSSPYYYAYASQYHQPIRKSSRSHLTSRSINLFRQNQLSRSSLSRFSPTRSLSLRRTASFGYGY